MIILNKKDLADERVTRAWEAYYKSRGIRVIAISCMGRGKGAVLDWIKTACAPVVQRYKEKGVNKVIRCMIAGIPNSGKSTLINLLCGRSRLKCENRPGVTRSTQWVKVDSNLELMDTPGVLVPRLEDEAAALNLCYIGSIKDSIIDTNELACLLLEKLSQSYAENIIQRYGIDMDEKGYVMLERICKKRGFILKGAKYDYDRGAAAVLEEYRSGTLGRISLEAPEVQ